MSDQLTEQWETALDLDGGEYKRDGVLGDLHLPRSQQAGDPSYGRDPERCTSLKTLASS